MRLHTSSRFPRLLLVAAVLTGGTACGGSDADRADAGVVTTAPTDAAPAPGDTDGTGDGGSGDGGGSGTGDGGIVEQIGGEGADDVIDNLGIGTKAFALASALGSDRDAEIVDATTARIFLDGDVDVDAITGCIVVNAIISAEETVILAYPNGEITCE